MTVQNREEIQPKASVAVEVFHKSCPNASDRSEYLAALQPNNASNPRDLRNGGKCDK